MEGNLTKGPILKTLTKLAVPIMASSFLGTLYNITDMAWIGLLGSRAVAGVGVGGMFTWLSQGLAAMARMGGQVHVAQCIGRGDRERAHGFAQAAVQLAAFMGMAYAILSLLFTRQMVGFFQLADAQAHAAAMSYTRIACGLIVFSFMTLTLTGLYTAQGDSKTPFIANLVGLATNMVLDPVLILGVGMFPKLGVAGAAIATVTAQAIVMSIMIVGIVIQKKENVLKETRLLAKIPREYLQGICKIGIPTAIQGMAYCAFSMVLTRMISGVCGRLMCCLKYEEDTYEELNGRLPNIGDYVTTDDGLKGEVHSVSILRQLVKVIVTVNNDEKEIREYKVDQLKFRPKKRREKQSSNDAELKQLEALEKKEGKSKLDGD